MTQPSSDLEAYRRELANLSLPRFASAGTVGPRVVALEGPNGAGKSTLCQLLAQELGAPLCLGTDEAWFSKPFKTRMIRDAEWFSSAMFFLSGCLEQMRTLQLRREPLIIMDRSMWSTLAVHAAQDADRLLRLIEMLKPIASEIRIPHHTLVLEASFATCQERIGKKQGEALALDKLTANEEFHSREKEFYRWLATQVSSVAFLDVNGDAPKELAGETIELCHLRRC